MIDVADIPVVESWLYGRPKRTQRAYLKDVEQAFAWLGRPMADVLLPDLQAYQTHLFGHCRQAASTVKRKTNALRSLFKFAHDQGLIERNPCMGLRSPKVAQRIDDKLLDKGQVRVVIAAAKPGRNQALLMFLYAVGCRVSEACGVTWKDITPKPDGSAVARLLGKGDKWRSVKVPAAVWAAVKELRGDAGSLDRVFGISERWAQEIARTAGYKAGAEIAVTPHTFRHCNASHAIEAGAPLPVVRDSLGHSSIAVTDIYAHSNPEQSSSDYLGL
ncbi:MAG: tyrosine-type recombinase/integrase [Leptolyngbyaceae cyanobacterium]